MIYSHTRSDNRHIELAVRLTSWRFSRALLKSTEANDPEGHLTHPPFPRLLPDSQEVLASI